MKVSAGPTQRNLRSRRTMSRRLAFAHGRRSVPPPKRVASTTSTFYCDLEPLPAFAEAAEDSGFKPAPGDGWVVVTDIIQSTRVGMPRAGRR